MAAKNLVVVRSPFFHGTRMVGVGEVWADDDDVVKNYPTAFRPLEIKSSAPAPAETPRVRRPQSRTRGTTKRQTKKS